MRRLSTVLTLLALAALAACTPKPTEPVAAPEPPPPALLAVSPPARSTSVQEDPEIWADFTVPLDSATVNSRNVFFKLYTVRLPAELAYDASTRRLRITPLVALTLLETYSVEFTPNLRSNGSPVFPSGHFWEFTIRGVRRVELRYPPAGATDVSPLTPLAWTGTEGTAGNISYAVYSGQDSSAVASRTSTARVWNGIPFLLAQSVWPAGARIFWTVTARNLSSGEALDGPVSSFTVLSAAGAPEAISLAPLIYGTYVRSNHNFGCGGSGMGVGLERRSPIRWPYEQIPSDAVVVDARMEFRTLPGFIPPGADLSVRATSDDWTTCTIGDPAPPYLERTLPTLSRTTRQVVGDSLLFALFSTQLTSHLCGVAAGIGLHGYLLESSGTQGFLFKPDPRSLTVYFHRRSTPPADVKSRPRNEPPLASVRDRAGP